MLNHKQNSNVEIVSGIEDMPSSVRIPLLSLFFILIFTAIGAIAKHGLEVLNTLIGIIF